MPDLESLGRLAEVEFLEIVQSTVIIENKLRATLIDGSYIDFWWSEEIPGRYAYHWERRRIDGTIYRHDNIPHIQGGQWVRSQSTFTTTHNRLSPKAICRMTRKRGFGSS